MDWRTPSPREMRSLTDIPWLVLVWLSKCRELDGLDVCIAGSRTDADDVMEKTGTALRLIAKYDSVLYRQIKSDIRLLLFTGASGGSYLAGMKACRIGIAYTRRVAPVELAMTIIHEGTHARLDRTGLRYDGYQREQIERTCIAAEIAFAERIPGSEEAAKASKQLLNTRWWEPERLAEDALIELRAGGVPKWLAKWIVRRAARRANTD